MSDGETVEILTGVVGLDRYGNDVVDWDDPTVVTVDGAVVAPRRSSEVEVGRTGVIVGLSLYLPPGTPITAADRVRVRGDTYTVEGQPGDWRDPFDGNRPVGVEVALEAVHG